MAPLIRERLFRKGDVLQEQAQTARRLAILKVGSAMALRRGRDGRPRAVGLFGRGGVLGKFALILEPNALTCVALSAGRLCEFDLEVLRGEAIFAKPLRAALTRAFASDFARLADWAQVMRATSVRAQLLGVLALLTDDQVSRRIRLPSQTTLAQLLGTTRETVARSLGALERLHYIVRSDRWHCEVLARAAHPS